MALLPPYWKAIKHSMQRRALWHDYTRRQMYMLTLLRGEEISCPFSRVIGDPRLHDCPGEPQVELTAVGKAIASAKTAMERQWPAVQIRAQVIMPDHVHLLVFVVQTFEPGLSFWVRKYKGECTRNCRRIGDKELGSLGIETSPLFDAASLSMQGGDDSQQPLQRGRAAKTRGIMDGGGEEQRCVRVAVHKRERKALDGKAYSQRRKDNQDNR